METKCLRSRAVAWLVASSIYLFHARVAWARAGGGGGYSAGGGGSSFSGSSSSSSGASGGSGDFTLFDLIVLLTIFAAALVAVYQRRRGAAIRTRRRREYAAHWAARLREGGGAFDLDRFERRARSAFEKIQSAWSDQDLGTVRGFMSDGLHERFSIQLREQRALGYHNRMSNVRVREACLVEAHRLEHFDVAAVRFVATATDRRIDLASGQEIADSRRAEHFVEVWSFLRGRSAPAGHPGGSDGAEGRASDGRGLFEGQCPNCAAPVDPARAWACQSCGSDLESAPPDWVLTEITQSGEWSVEDRSDDTGMKAATARDPGLTREQLEDRASVLFWRLMDSFRTGRAAELAGSSRPAMVSEQTRRLATDANRYVGDCAVGSVRLRGILPGQEWDLALVEVRWSGGLFLRAARGGRPTAEETQARRLQRHLLVMARRAGTRSPVGRCIVSAHCVQCGAPDEGALEDHCRFCGEVWADGRDWLLDRFIDLSSSDAAMLLSDLHRDPIDSDDAADSSLPTRRPDTPSLPGGTELLAWILTVAYSDGHLDRREIAAIERFSRRLGISSSITRKLERAAQFSRLEVQPPADRNEAAAWLASLSEMARADGRVTRREDATLRRLADRVGVDGDTTEFVQRERESG